MKLANALFLVVAASAAVASACSAGSDGSPSPVLSGGSGGSDASAGKGGNTTGGQAGEGAEGGQGGEAGEGGQAGEGGSAEGGSAGAAGEDAGPPCDKHWTREICPTVGATPNASYSIEAVGGAMVLKETLTPMMCGTQTAPEIPIKLMQSGLEGNFEISFSVENFSAASYGAGVRAFVVDMTDNGELAEAMLSDNGSGLEMLVRVTHQNSPSEDKATTKTSSATFTIKRVNALVTVTVEAGTDKKTLSGMVNANKMRVGIGLNGPYNTPNPAATSSVNVTGFTVTNGGGTVVPDAFDCYSVY